MDKIEQLIRQIPKAELHCHIEGTLEPELMFELAERNQIPLNYSSPDALRKAYDFTDLQSFLDIYYQGANVLRTEQDFYDLTWAYLKRAHEDNVRHTEIFFDPQTHTDRSIPFRVVIEGINSALANAEKQLGMTTNLIMCFLRHLSEEDAFKTLQESMIFQDKIIAVGLDSSEKGNKPAKFKQVFDAAKTAGYLAVAHAGEEGPAENIWDAINLLHAQRIDHGVRCTEDPKLVTYLKEKQIPLTVCPLSNVKLGVFDKIKDHNIKTLLQLGLCVLINCDDPAYFGGYVVDNYLACYRHLNLSVKDIVQLAKNSFNASFISDPDKQKYLSEIQMILDAQAIDVKVC